MRFRTPNLDVEVKYKKAGNELLVPKPPIRLRSYEGVPVDQVRVVADRTFMRNGKTLAIETKLIDPETEELVPSSEALEILKHYSYKYLDANGKEVEKENIRYFAVQPDGSEVEVSPFSRTDTIEVPEENWVPSPSIDGFLIENVYEMFHPKKDIARKLFDEAEVRLKKDQIGITNFSWGNGFIQYYLFACPFINEEGQYVWLLKFTSTKLAYNHMQDPPVKAKIPIREAPPLKTLPPVQALVIAATKKGKK